MAKDQPVIFLVDADEVYLLQLKNMLSGKLAFKTSIFTYNSGEECIKNLGLGPDIIVLDYYFTPNAESGSSKKPMNGIELIAYLKKAAPLVHLVMLTSETDVEVANMAINEGANDYIIKYEYAPIQLQYLISNIILHKTFREKVNYWKWGAIAIGVLFILMLIYLVTGVMR